MKRLRSLLCVLLAVSTLVSVGFGGTVVTAAIEGCKIIDVSLENFFVENMPNTLNITVGSESDSADFSLAVYDGDMYRHKIYEGDGHVEGHGSGSDQYGSTVISVPIAEHPKGIINFDIYLTQAGQTVVNSASFYIYAQEDITNSLLITQDVNNYTYFQKLMKQKGNNAVVTADPTEAQIRSASAVIMGTSAVELLSDRVLSAIANSGRNIVLFKDKDISAAAQKINTFLSDSRSSLKYYNDIMTVGGNTDIKINIYGGLKYNIVSWDLSHDSQIRGKDYHGSDLSPVYSQNGENDSAEAVVKMNDQASVSGGKGEGLDFNALMVDLLPGSAKIAVAGSNFLGDDELRFSSEALFAEETYRPAYLREYTNYNVLSNLMDWILPVRFYKDSTVSTVKTDGTLTYVSVTGALMTSSEAVDSHRGTAFHNYVYLQDETGGIRVYGISTEYYASYKTFKVNIKGYVSSYAGEKEIYVYDQANDVTRISNGDNSIAPQVIGASGINDGMVGNLVKINAVVSDAAFGSLTLKDATGEAKVYIDSYIGSSQGKWAVGTYDPRIGYGCMVAVIGIVSKQDGDNVIRVRDTGEILLLKDQNGNDVEPPVPEGNKFGKGLQEIAIPDTKTIIVGNEQKEFTNYMSLMVDLELTTAAELPARSVYVGQVFTKMLERCGIHTAKKDNITVRDGAIQILTGLGYDYFYKDDAGYNIDMLIGSTKLLAGISADRNSLLTAEDGARMIYNALDTPYFGAVSYTSNGASQYGTLNKCILDDLKLTRATGVITETRYTGLNNAMGRNEVTMQYSYSWNDGNRKQTANGTGIFRVKSESVADYVGQGVEAYIRDIGDENLILAAYPLSGNSVCKLENGDYADYKDGSLTYRDEDNHQREITIAQGAALSVNGIRNINGVTKDLLENPFTTGDTMDKAGRIYGWYTFIDNNSDGEMDYVKIEVYRDYIVGAVDKSTFRIDDKIAYNNSGFYLDETDSESHLIYRTSTGENAGFDDIAKGDVLSIAAAKTDGKNILWGTVVITKGYIEGRVNSIDERSMELAIDDVWHDYVVLDPYRLENFGYKIEDEGKFYVNMKGTVIMKDISAIPFVNYAYVLQYGYVRENLETTPAVVVFLPTGRWETFTFAKNVTVLRGLQTPEQLKRDSFVNTYLKDPSTGALNKCVNSLINFEKNAKDEITKIVFSDVNSSGKNDKSRLTIDRRYNQPVYSDNIPALDEKTEYDAKNKNIGDAYLSDHIVIFDVTLHTGETLDSVNNIHERINIISAERLTDGSHPVISLFDMGDGNECAAAITINAGETPNQNDNLFIVTNTVQRSVGDDILTCIYGYQNGEGKELLLDEDVKITDFLSGKPRKIYSGDVILYEQSSAFVRNIQVIMNVGAAQYCLPNIYGDGSFIVPQVNFYSDKSNLRQRVNYYFGLVTEKYQNKRLGKLLLAKDNTPFPSAILDKLQFTGLVATDDSTVFYRIYPDNPNRPVAASSLADATPSTSGSFGTRNGDLALVKTVNGTATDVILITP